ncbi:MAG: hypothetical protein OEW18_10960, partial [Candidatus Aminicenantes bacterium]|nr:hypothetical protein [Candidatus Aminicenantes bacterium]
MEQVASFSNRPDRIGMWRYVNKPPVHTSARITGFGDPETDSRCWIRAAGVDEDLKIKMDEFRKMC